MVLQNMAINLHIKFQVSKFQDNAANTLEAITKNRVISALLVLKMHVADFVVLKIPFLIQWKVET